MKARFLEIHETGAIINIDNIIGIFPFTEDIYEIRWEVCGKLFAQAIKAKDFDGYWDIINKQFGIA